MNIEWVKLQEDGRILIPAVIRKSINARPGDRLCLSIDEDGNLKIQSKLSAIVDAQNYFGQFKEKGEDVVQDFIVERKASAIKECEE